ncbi:hypothetical protein Clacol_007417 [Clathrus columnatus]|uniref:Uncharacterized protein n=1 Tax=Clathrus columnatus TaxID=1419009 RepID=A0AAV5AJP9_9AGAM|nr:hypothetical protein Clacol_007417 [Clathrus columnatus]
MVALTRSQRQALESNDQAEVDQKFSLSTIVPAPPAPVFELPVHLPHDNLRAYVRSAQVSKAKFRRNHPPICRGVDRIAPDRYLLSVEPDSRLRLKEVWVSRPPNMADRVKAFIRTIPSSPIHDADSRGTYIRTANLNIPAPGFLTFIDPPTQVDDAMSLAKTTMRVLETAERVVNLVWPEESRGVTSTFATDCCAVSEADANICVPLHYMKIRERDLVSVIEPKVKMVVIVLAPWAIAMADMHEMLTVGKFPPFENSDGTKHTFTRAQKIWAQQFTNSGNPDISRSDNLQLSYRQSTANMTPQDWLDTYLGENLVK